MKTRKDKIENVKWRGEWAEMYFMACASERGLQVSRPYGEAHFDFIIGDRGGLLRVQVKSTLSRCFNGYGCNVRGTHDSVYSTDDFDFLAVLVIPERVWYLIPSEVAAGQAKVFLRPDSPQSKYAPYKEAWHLLAPHDCPLRTTIGHIEASEDWSSESRVYSLQ
jgi:hypothetical protein